MTLEQLAKASSLTRGYLSLVERGIKTPSVATLLRLAGVLELPVERLFDPAATDATEYAIDRVGDAAAQGNGATPLSVHALAAHLSNKIMEPFIVRPSTTAMRTPTMRHVRHAGEEMLYVLEGRVEVELSGERFQLAKGESIYFSGEKEHSLSSVGPVQAEVLLIIAKTR